MAMRKPAEVFPPGEFVRDELEERGWTQADLAEIVGWPLETITEMIIGTRRISPEMAQALSAAFGTSAELWMNLDAAYQLSCIENDGGNEIRRRAELFSP